MSRIDPIIEGMSKANMMPTKISDHRKKYAFYLRQKPLNILLTMMNKHPEKSLSSVICLILDQYRIIQARHPGAIAMAKNYADKLRYDFIKGEFVQREQAYLNNLQEECLEAYTRLYTDGNLSQALNKMIGEYACLNVVCPHLFTPNQSKGKLQNAKPI